MKHKSIVSAQYELKHHHVIDPSAEIYDCEFCGFMHIGTLYEERAKQGKLKTEKSKFQTKRQRKEMTGMRKKQIRRRGQ